MMKFPSEFFMRENYSVKRVEKKGLEQTKKRENVDRLDFDDGNIWYDFEEF